MGAVLRWITLRHLFHEGGRSFLTLFGVILGVAVWVGIRLANHSAMSSFAETVNVVAGRANLQVVCDTAGFDAGLLAKVRAVPGVAAAAPIVQTYALARLGGRARETTFVRGEASPYDETLLVLGVDLPSEAPFARYEATEREKLAGAAFVLNPAAVAVTRSLADRHHLRTGQPLTLLSGGRPATLFIQEIVESEELQQAMGGSVAVVNLGTAQSIFHREAKLDRIDLIVDAGRREPIQAAIRALLPPGTRVTLPEVRTRQVENMVRAFDLNLTALSFIALLVSMFLIFNAVSMSVLRRRREIGILRSLGLTRRQVIGQFLSEGLSLGLVGSLIGLGAGTLMAKAALGSVARTITALYLVVRAEHLALDLPTYLAGFALGVGMALLSSLAPALEASRTPPNVTVRQGILIEAQPLPIGRWTLGGLGLLLAAAGIAAWTVRARQPFGGFVSATLLVLGFSLLSPGFTLLCEGFASRALRGLGTEAVLGARYLREAIARTSVVVAALMISVGMMVGLSIMVGSFRQTVSVWVNQTIRGDLYIEPVGRKVTGSHTVLSPEVERIVRSLPDVAAVDTYRSLEIDYRGAIGHLIAIEFAVQRDRGRLQFMNGPAAEILGRALREDGVVVSESFAFRHRLRPGDRVRLDSPSGPVSLPVEGVYYDYSTDAGAVMMDHALYRRLWKEERTENLAVYLQPGADPAKTRELFIRRLGGRHVLYVTPNQSLRSQVLTIFDQTFQITYALQAIAILVAVLGVITTLTGLILQRGREIGVLRAVGALRRQVGKMVLTESALLGLIGALMGCAAGLCLALLLIFVINKQFFGWTIRLTVDPWLFVQSVVLMVITALIAGLVPARLAAGRLAAEAMRVE
jgi:putative ABC transport system permease protein